MLICYVTFVWTKNLIYSVNVFVFMLLERSVWISWFQIPTLSLLKDTWQLFFSYVYLKAMWIPLCRSPMGDMHYAYSFCLRSFNHIVCKKCVLRLGAHYIFLLFSVVVSLYIRKAALIWSNDMSFLLC